MKTWTTQELAEYLGIPTLAVAQARRLRKLVGQAREVDGTPVWFCDEEDLRRWGLGVEVKVVETKPPEPLTDAEKAAVKARVQERLGRLPTRAAAAWVGRHAPVEPPPVDPRPLKPVYKVGNQPPAVRGPRKTVTGLSPAAVSGAVWRGAQFPKSFGHWLGWQIKETGIYGDFARKLGVPLTINSPGARAYVERLARDKELPGFEECWAEYKRGVKELNVAWRAENPGR